MCHKNEIMNMLVLWLHHYVLLVNIGNFVNAADSQQWNDFMIQYAKNYETTELEQQKMETFHKNMDKIAKHNEKFKKGEVLYEMGMNHFGDMTAEEFAKAHLSNIKPADQLNEMSDAQQHGGSLMTSLPPNSGTVPTYKNWVSEGAVTGIKSQGVKCGCCWAFATVAVIESHYFIHTKKLVSLSEQNLLDCVESEPYGEDHNCNEGTLKYSLWYIVDNGGIDTEKSYPYKEKQGECLYKAQNKGVTIKGYKKPQPGNENLLRDIVGVIGPVCCTFNAEPNFIQFYKSGIFSSETCGDKVNHGVVLVGYGKENNIDFWIVKNSWGTEWGEEGYFKLIRGKKACAITVESYYPVI